MEREEQGFTAIVGKWGEFRLVVGTAVLGKINKLL